MYLVTGASGQLGRLIVNSLINRGVAASNIAVLVRSPEKASDLAERGVVIRNGDYTDTASLAQAFEGISRAVLVSSSEVGQRFTQHQNVINAAKEARVQLLAYTSILHADKSPLALAEEHVQTEALLAEADVPYVLLRNGWYIENYTGTAKNSVEQGVVLGSAGDGKICAASRADYAEAAAAVITADNQAGKVYELAGDIPFTMVEYAAQLAETSGKPVVYQNLTADAYTQALVEVGIPTPFAEILADTDVGVTQGALFDDSHTLSQLIGHQTVTVKSAIESALT